MKASKLVKKAILCFPTQSPRPSRFCISTDTSYISARRTHRCMILHPAQYLGVADILTKRQNILSTVEKWQTESDTICCVEELLFWRRATHKKTRTGAFKHMANSPLHCRSAVNLSQVVCWQAPQSTAYSSGTITTDVSRGQKDISLVHCLQQCY